MQYIQKAFSLIELMIVVAIIGVLAAVAVPAYQDYITRAQVTEVISILGSLKSPVVAHYAEHGTFPDTTELLSTGVVKLPTRYVADIIAARINGTGFDVFTMAAVMPTTGISDKVKDKVILLSTPDGGKRWFCHVKIARFLIGNGGFPLGAWNNKDLLGFKEQKYLPPNCRGT